MNAIINPKKLPDLPRIKKQSEARSALKFREWIAKNPRATAAIEMKDTRGNSSLPFSEVTDEQIAYGLAIKSDKGVLLRVQGLSGEPDYIYMRNEPSYVVIKYPNCFTIIDIETFVLEKKRSKTRSLKESRAKELAIYVI